MISTEGFIDDGYTLAGFIAGQTGVYEDLEFTYRPVQPMDERRLAVKQRTVATSKTLTDEEKEIQLEVLAVEMVTKNILSWNLTDNKGTSQPITVAAVMCYFPGLRYERLMQIVRHGLQSDPRPDGEENPPSVEDAEKNLPEASN